MNSNLDLLLVEPSLDWEKSLQRLDSRRIDKKEDYKEGLKISTGYLVAAVKESGHKVKFIDMIVEEMNINDLIKYIEENNPRVIGMSSFTFQIPIVFKLFHIIKKRFSHIILCIGGCHASALPEETLNSCSDIDFLFKGEAETNLPLVLDRIESGLDFSDIAGVFMRGKEASNDILVEDVNNTPFPAWEEFHISRYSNDPDFPDRKITLPVLTGRGCPFRCIFCCRQSGGKCRRRKVESVIEEIERNVKEFNCDTIGFIDETFILNKKWINEFIELMVYSGLYKKVKWATSTRADSVSLDLLKELKRVGCYNMQYGFESGNPKTLKIINKGTTVEQMENAIKWTKQVKIAPNIPIMIGLPGETREDVIRSIKWGTSLNAYSITFPILVPYPGTEVRRMALAGEYGMRIISDDWKEYLANDQSLYGGGDIGHLESSELSWKERIELQKYGYSLNPKKNISKYIESL